jgi:hypothetical protein
VDSELQHLLACGQELCDTFTGTRQSSTIFSLRMAENGLLGTLPQQTILSHSHAEDCRKRDCRRGRCRARREQRASANASARQQERERVGGISGLNVALSSSNVIQSGLNVCLWHVLEVSRHQDAAGEKN